MVRARSVDRNGDPLPMLTYPALDFLHSIEHALADCDVLEFGCGQSTKWFSSRVRRLIGIEKNAAFNEILQREFSGTPHVSIHDNAQPFAVDGTFDIILLDGEPRLDSGHFAPSVLKTGGIMILDNSDVQSLAPLTEHFHELGFARVDYFGYSPTGVRKQCTSVFFRERRFFRLQSRVKPISPNSFTEKLH